MSDSEVGSWRFTAERLEAALTTEQAASAALYEALELVMSKHMRSKKGGYWMQHGSFQDSLDHFETLVTTYKATHPQAQE